ncbi:GntR family transcriptional regulator/MocR family aminotransferase [Actinoplanes octamycinicus]|uniref:GntR family transcriptional regulator/MocR family aminotransferase n=1 Tax=Actinoplanes octamycinicus TaxID=135948 RepID=A0A7W7M9X3_9ACTN|nr:PLP-dependent aminotransferase family protein [Actinoplanes octamycinicus]MBB4742367.1 GntR family transcriptional regulator/MocR family aminotransferase [Actinoplanes octamycinicus]GIE62384.1 GntR family transcriptional regulator [Actinoplanes octamycinicus]
MRVEWAGSGPELLVTIDRDSTTGLRSQLEEQLRTAIRGGRLTAGEPLPSSRELARALGLSRGLVQDCYAQLQAEGYLTSRPGSATRVAAAAARPTAPPPVPVPPPVSRHPVADFAHGVPDLGMVPREAWAWAVREVCRSAPDADFDYGDAAGHPRLRQVLASYLSRVRAVAAGPDDLIVCTGMRQSLHLVVETLSAAGSGALAVEHPGSAMPGMATVPIPVDDDGLDVAALRRTELTAVVVSPAHQWPTGVVLTGPRRLDLIAWARERDGIIVEDDYDAEFRYDRDPVGSLQGLAPDHVVSLGTVSKSLAPALRLGWIIAPPRLRPALAEAKWLADRGSPAIDQLALALLIESGRYDRHLRRVRAEYAARRETLVAALARHAPQLPVTGLAAGFHAILHLPPGADETAVVEAAARRGVGLYGMGHPPARLILGFGNTSRSEIETGIAAIADLLA